MGLLWLRFRSLCTTPDWRAEAMEAAAASDWPRFAYCFAATSSSRKSDRLDLNQPLGTRESGCLPLHLCLQSRDLHLIMGMIAAGADLDALAPAAPAACHYAPPCHAGQRMPQVNAIIVARLLQAPAEISDELWRRSNTASRYRACLAALRLNHTAWLEELDFANCFGAVEGTLVAERHARNANERPRRTHLGPSDDSADWERTMALLLPWQEDAPIIEALRGSCPLPVVQRVWRASPDIMREAYWIESPGYGHDHDPVYAGFAIDYARHVKRDDVVAFLQSELKNR